MKKRIRTCCLILCILVFVCPLKAQIPNASFENWTGGEPDGWWTNNESFLNLVGITESNNAEAGTKAAECAVVSLVGQAIAPELGVGTYTHPGFPVSKKYTSLNGYYKFNPSGKDQFSVSVSMWKNGSIIGGGNFSISDKATAYKEFSVDIKYGSVGIPDTCFITISIDPSLNNDSLHLGSSAVVDNLSLSTVTAVTSVNSSPGEYKLYQNYPNPFNPSTTIGYKIPARGLVILKIYDELGREVKTLVNDIEQAGRHEATFNAAGFSSGVYFCEMKAGNFRKVMKLLLTK